MSWYANRFLNDSATPLSHDGGSDYQVRRPAGNVPPVSNTCGRVGIQTNVHGLTSIIHAMLRRAAPLVIAFALIAPAVQASPQCMTKQEARAKWPAKPIYLHGSSRCWNDQPLSSRHLTTPAVNTSDSATKALALDSSAPRAKATKTEIFFPSVVVKNSASTDFFTGTPASTELFAGAPMTGWPLLINVDDEAPNPNNGVDGCCWPSLDALRALVEAVK